MLGGAVHAAAASPMYFQQGNLPIPIVQGQVVPADAPAVLAEGQTLPRTNTSQILSRFRNTSKFILLSGLCSTTFYLLICAVYMWFSLSIPQSCNAPLDQVYFGLAVLNFVMGAIMACYLCVAHTMLSAMSHGVIADKYRYEGREDEASSQESDYETEAKWASKGVLVPTCLYLLTTNGMVAYWVFGIFEAMKADDRLCDGAGFVFWVLLAMNLLNCCLSSSSGASAYQTQAPTGYMLG